jgi:hypothetical protein
MIAFELTEPAPADLEIPIRPKRSRHLEFLDKPKVLKGQTIGYLRVRGIREGEDSLRVGSAELAVRIKRRSRLDELSNAPPRLLSPVHGSFVWGEFTAAVECFHDPLDPRSPQETVRLLLPGGTSVKAGRVSSDVEGPFHRLLFTVDARTLPAGPGQFILRSSRPDGRLEESDPVQVHVSQVGRVDVEGECENHPVHE